MTKLSKKRREIRHHNEEKCRRKTARGNVYHSELEAQQAAREVQEQSLYQVVAFYCTVCKLWHIGGRGLKTEYKDIAIESKFKHMPVPHIGASMSEALKKAGIKLFEGKGEIPDGRNDVQHCQQR